jgi:hypothetical protein
MFDPEWEDGFGVTLDESRGSAEYNFRSKAEFEARGEDSVRSSTPDFSA